MRIGRLKVCVSRLRGGEGTRQDTGQRLSPGTGLAAPDGICVLLGQSGSLPCLAGTDADLREVTSRTQLGSPAGVSGSGSQLGWGLVCWGASAGLGALCSMGSHSHRAGVPLHGGRAWKAVRGGKA